MDRSWVRSHNRHWSEYINGIKEFTRAAHNNKDSIERVICPCGRCKNRAGYLHINIVEEHLWNNGIDRTYTRWVHHGEDYEILSDDDYDDGSDEENISSSEEEGSNGLHNMLEELRAAAFANVENATQKEEFANCSNAHEVNQNTFDNLLNDAVQPLYPGCLKFMKLDFVVKLLHLKIINNWTNKSFNMNIELFKAALPIGETLPKSYYESKTLIRNLGLGYVPINAYIYDCVIFWKEYENLMNCPICNEPRYKVVEGKGRKIPRKVLRYFPLKPRFQRLFASKMISEDMR